MNHRDSSDNNDLLGVGTWASGSQHTSDKTGTAGKKDTIMSASLVRWVDNPQDDPWNHVTGGKSDKPAGGEGRKNPKA